MPGCVYNSISGWRCNKGYRARHAALLGALRRDSQACSQGDHSFQDSSPHVGRWLWRPPFWTRPKQTQVPWHLVCPRPSSCAQQCVPTSTWWGHGAPILVVHKRCRGLPSFAAGSRLLVFDGLPSGSLPLKDPLAWRPHLPTFIGLQCSRQPMA